MSEDKELIEVWRAEFVIKVKETKEYEFAMDSIKPFIFDVDKNGKFKKSDTETLWQGFILAKRSQPSVVLPQTIRINEASVSSKQRITHNDLLVKIVERLTSAGIKYTTGE